MRNWTYISFDSSGWYCFMIEFLWLNDFLYFNEFFLRQHCTKNEVFLLICFSVCGFGQAYWGNSQRHTLRCETIYGDWKPFKNDEKRFLFHLLALFVLKMFKLLSWHFGHTAKQLDKKVKVSFKFYDVTAWLINICNTHIVQYLEK